MPKHRHGKGPRGLGWSEDFYAVLRKDGTISQEIDDYLQTFERSLFGSGKADCSVLAKCVYDDSFFPTSRPDRDSLSACLAFTVTRCPLMLHNTAMLGELTVNVRMFNLLGNEPEHVLASFAHEQGISSPPDPSWVGACAHQRTSSGRPTKIARSLGLIRGVRNELVVRYALNALPSKISGGLTAKSFQGLKRLKSLP